MGRNILEEIAGKTMERIDLEKQKNPLETVRREAERVHQDLSLIHI